MLKQETLKHAIDAITARDPEIGYSLGELFGTGRIRVAAPPAGEQSGDLDYFAFDHQLVPVRKINYFTEGSAAIEQKLIVRYGEMIRKQELALSGDPLDYGGMLPSIRQAGLRCLVEHEIKQAGKLSAASAEAAGVQPLLDELQRGLAHPPPEALSSEGLAEEAAAEQAWFSGMVNADTPALFLPLPYTPAALLQVAEMDLSFFSVRFVLNCLVNGQASQLFAAVVADHITGLVYIRHNRSFLHHGIEIKYIATARDAAPSWKARHPSQRGVGTFLVAGVWLLWKNLWPRAGEIVLDAEIQATGFYEQIGFKKRRPYVYTLTRPAGNLINVLAVMIDRTPAIAAQVVHEVTGWIRPQVRLMARRKGDDPARRQALAFIRLCLLSRQRPELARTAAAAVLRLKSRLPEAESLLAWSGRHGRIRITGPEPGSDPGSGPGSEYRPAPSGPAPWIFRDSGMHRHLEGLCHLENANRLNALETVLEQPQLSGKWVEIQARKAGIDQLAWVHTPDYISRLSATTGKPLFSFDPDTQTTPLSFDAARLAVGGVFSLLKAVFTTPSGRGFAAVRPPGHHAEPDKAMGFCLLNNVALGACYLIHEHGAKKVMIVDIDAHHGNGTQKVFYENRQVLFVSLHQYPCYPGSGNYGELGRGDGEGFSVNVPLDRMMGDRHFVQVIHHLVDPLARAFAPEVILVSCGFDLYRHDRLANLNGTPEGYAMLTHLLCRIADRVCGGRIAFIMEGGYSIQGIRECGLKVIESLCGLPGFDEKRLAKIISQKQSLFSGLQKTIAIHQSYWPILNR